MRVLERLTTVEEGKGRDVPPEYLYYGVPCPWLQSKTLRALQYFAMPDAEDDRALLKQILNVCGVWGIRPGRNVTAVLHHGRVCLPHFACQAPAGHVRMLFRRPMNERHIFSLSLCATACRP